MLTQRLHERLVERASQKWCDFRRGGRPCDHGATTFLIPVRDGHTSGFACNDHARQMVATGAWRDPRA